MSINSTTKIKKKEPLVSIITPSYNQAEYLKECVDSILKQSYKNYEHIIVDGASKDNTVALLKQYKHIRWISEKDSGYWDALLKGIKMAKGKYITICMVSDGYMNQDWLKKCVEVLENDKEVSLVWGFPRWLQGNKLTDVCYPHFQNTTVPQKDRWMPYWLLTGEALPNGNFCMHKKVFEKCNTIKNGATRGEELFNLNYNFNIQGYLPYNIPEVADFSRQHDSQLSQVWINNGWYKKAIQEYNEKIEHYKNDLLSGRKKHIYRDSDGRALSYKPDLKKLDRLNKFYLRSKIMLYLLVQRGPGKLKERVAKILS